MRPTTAANALFAFVCICFNVNAFSATLNLSVASTANEQGLITALAERFQEKYPEHQVVISEVGALVALDRARNNEADAILTHHPASELVFMDDGLGLSRTQIMYNQFAILGPNSDPLGISAEDELIEVLRLLADNEVDFFVQGVKSGTYQRFAELMEIAKVQPDWLGYQSMDSSSRTTVLAAARFNAYAFADLGTYFSLREVISDSISPLYRDHKSLQNYYNYIVVNPDKLPAANPELANLFLEFLISNETQNFINKFGREEYQTNLFTPAAHLDNGLQIRAANKALERQQKTVLALMLFSGVVFALFMGLGGLHIKTRRLEHERKANQARFTLAVSGTNDGIWDWDALKLQLFLAQRTRDILGVDGEFSDLPELLDSIILPTDLKAYQNAFANFLNDSSEHYLDKEFRISTRNGERWIRLRGKAHRDLNGNILRMAGSVTDSTDIHQQQEAIRYQALHDALTDLPNRALLFDRLHQTIIHAQRQDEKFALLMIDLDRFKQINDTLGHNTGDILIQMVAKRLQAVLRESDTVSRLGGDEFAVLLPSVDQVQANHVARKIEIAMKRYFNISDNHLIISGSIGMVMFPDHGETSESLLQHADVAMYQAKKDSTHIAVYSADKDANSIRSLEIESRLREAIDRDELDLYYQPKVDLRRQRIIGVEALLRWHDPVMGNINIEELVSLAEKTGLIRPLTKWVIRHALQTSHYWSTRLHIELPISINLSIWDLQDPNFAAHVRKEVERWYRTPRHIEFEITESAMMSDPEKTIATLGQLASMGHLMSVDDFGTGFSSLAYLKKFPVRSLKIDRSFVSDMETDNNDHVIVRSTIDMAHGMGMNVIAEGVESEALLKELMMMGCDIAQGYHISRPLPAEEFIEWTHQAKWKMAAFQSGRDSSRHGNITVH
jgi:diguanylate cyclase (GGDEF)-like protein